MNRPATYATRQVRDDDQRADYILYRQRVLPTQLQKTRAKLRALENECRRYGMNELLEKSS